MALFKRRKLQKQRGSFKTTPKEAKKIGGSAMVSKDQMKRIIDALLNTTTFLNEHNEEEKREIEIAIERITEAAFWLNYSVEEEEE